MEREPCDYSQLVKMQLMWLDTAAILSLDIGRVFYDELGLAPFLSERLRDVARDCIQEVMLYQRRNSLNVSRIHMDFPLHISENLGEEVLQAVRSWQEIALPRREVDRAYSGWILFLLDLRNAWDDEVMVPGLPLAEVECAEARLHIRGFLGHTQHMLQETERAVEQVISSDGPDWAWDRRALLRLRQPSGRWLLPKQISDNLRSRDLWTWIRSNLSPVRIEELTTWAQAEARRHNLRPEAGIPPCP